MYFQSKRYNKFGNKSTQYNGSYYDSIKEADYAQSLDLRMHAKGKDKLKSWKRQVPIELRINDQKICTYKIDFVETDMNDNDTYTEIKGFETPEWRLKWKIFDALYPEYNKQVIK
jgi:hypothetical protein